MTSFDNYGYSHATVPDAPKSFPDYIVYSSIDFSKLAGHASMSLNDFMIVLLNFYHT